MRAETASSIQHNSSELFSGDAASVKQFCETTCGMGMRGGVFFTCPAEASGSATRGTHNVSFFSPEANESGAGLTVADNSGENEGGLTG